MPGRAVVVRAAPGGGGIGLPLGATGRPGGGGIGRPVSDRGGPGWGWGLVSGLASVGAGIIAITWPEITLFAVAIVAGVWMIVIGFMRLIAVFTGGGTASSPPPAVAV